MTRTNQPKYPGWRTMTAAQRYNARMHRLFDDARRLQAEAEKECAAEKTESAQ
jgi:hypothetical protein